MRLTLYKNFVQRGASRRAYQSASVAASTLRAIATSLGRPQRGRLQDELRERPGRRTMRSLHSAPPIRCHYVKTEASRADTALFIPRREPVSICGTSRRPPRQTSVLGEGMRHKGVGGGGPNQFRTAAPAPPSALTSAPFVHLVEFAPTAQPCLELD